MLLFTTILLVIIKPCISIADNNCVIDNRSLQNMWEQKILEYIGCNNNPSEPPPANKTHPTVVTISFTLKSFKYLSIEQRFSAYTWTFLAWNDSRLTWDPNQYDGIGEIITDGYRIWAPGVKLYNTVNTDLDEGYFSYSTCEIKSTGEVRCMIQDNYEAICSSDLRNWPYDSQKCELIFGPWFLDKEKTVLLAFSHRAMTMISSEYGSEWDIMDYNQFEDQSSKDKQLTMTFTLERHAEVLAAIIVFPCIVITVLSVSILALDVRSNLRLGLLCFSVFIHYNFLSQMGYHIPAHNMTSPDIVIYFRISMFLIAFSLFLSYFLSVSCVSERKVPDFVMKINNGVFNSVGRFLIWPRWSLNEKCNKEFVLLSNIINTLWIVITLIAYIITYILFVPTFAKMESTIPKKSYIFE